MLKLSLTRRPAKIGKSVNTRTEMHGDEEVPGLDIPITGMLINAEELGLVCDDPETHDRLYKTDAALGVIPAFQAIETIHLDHKFENASVRINGASIDKCEFGKAKIKSIRLERQVGGLTLMSFTLQVNPENGIDVPKLLNAKIMISVKSAELEMPEADDPELPFDHSDSATAEEPADDDDTLSRTGRKIQAAARKKARKNLN